MAPFPLVEFRAIVLAGGRSSRLRESAPVPIPDKPLLSRDGRTVLGSVLEDLERYAGVGADRCVVVGPEDIPVPEGTGLVREDPPFSGPAAAIRAGLSEFPALDSWTFVVAADMPHPGPGLAALRRAVTERTPDDAAFVGSDDGRWQPLLSVLRLDRARDAFAEPAGSQSVMSILKRLSPTVVEVPAGSSADVDTWDDAVALGYVARPNDLSTRNPA